MFRLLRYFSVASLATTILVAIIIGILYYRASHQTLQQLGERENIYLGQILIDALWPEITDVLKHAESLNNNDLRHDPALDILQRKLHTYLQNSTIFRVKLYDLNGRTVFSTEAEQISHDESDDEGFIAAKAGNVLSELTYRGEIYSLDKLLVNQDMLATYLPVRGTPQSKPIGIFELYSDVTPLLKTIHATQKKLILYFVIALILLYIVLFLIVRRADKIIKRHESERENHQAQILFHACHDSLTGLPNRNLFHDRLTHAMTRANRNNRLIALMFIDLDRFKTVNDTLGHNIGDQLLKAVTGRLRKCIRECDTVARLGGDEFTIVLENLDNVAQVTDVAERILDVMSKPFRIEQHEIFTSPSIGITLYPFDDDDVNNLISFADIAMYHAKEKGKNNYKFYSAEMSIRTKDRLSLESHLRRALEKEEFVLYYQPKIDLSSGVITGMEALLRWKSPDRGLVSPLEFVPLLEETGLILAVGDWVLRTACRQNKIWQSKGFPSLKVAVNISAMQFRQENIAEQIGRALRDTGLEPKDLELEITESTLIDNIESAVKVLLTLHKMGIFIAIDDFGTGYSSLSYLKRFQIDCLKIDRSFVRDVTTDPDDAAIATAIIALAHSLRLTVVAEGVETENHLAFLNAHHCDEAQGFLFSKPLPAEEFEKLLSENKHWAIQQNNYVV